MSAALAYPIFDETLLSAANDNIALRRKVNNRAYGYDGLGYLKTANGPWGAGSYKYDALGNLREKKLGARTVSLSYDETRNRLIRSHDDTGPTGDRWIGYDSRGNVTSLGTLAMTYDRMDQPIAISGTANGVGSANGNYRYDGNMKRVRSSVNGKTIYNVYDAGGALVHIDKATEGKKTDYVSGPTGTLARITNGVVTYLHPDHLGSAQSGTTSTGAIAWREQYTPFGEHLQNPAANDNLDGFTGHIKDKDTGLNYMQARYYDPVIGRFLSIDPVTFMDTGLPGQFNRYAYTWNDPINANDPDGEFINFIVGAAIGTVIEGISIAAEGGDPFDVKGNAGRYGKAALIGSVTGGVAGGVSKGIIKGAAKHAAPGQTTSKALQIGNQIAADSVGGAVGAAAGEVTNQLVTDGAITNTDQILDQAVTGGVFGAAASTVGQGAQALSGAVLKQGSGLPAAIGGATSEAVGVATSGAALQPTCAVQGRNC